MENRPRGGDAAGGGWNDVGSWTALWEVGQHDADGNIERGDVINIDTRDSYIDAASRLVATVGVEHLVVVETADAVLVASKDRVQEVEGHRRPAQGQPPPGRFHAPQGLSPLGLLRFDSIWMLVFRSSASWFGPAPVYPRRCTIIAPNTGWWSAAPPAYTGAMRSSC